jgi:hypothetical protein
VFAFGNATNDGNASSPLHPPDYPAFYQLPPTRAVAGAYLGPGPQPARTGGLRVAFLGESEAVLIGQWTTPYVPKRDPGTLFANGGIQGCGVVGALPLETYSAPGAPMPTLPACGLWAQQDLRTLALSHPNVVVVELGYWESQQHVYEGQLVTTLDSPPYRAYLTAQLDQLCRLVANAGARLVLLGAPSYGDGTPSANVAAFNALLADVAHANHATLFALQTLVDPTGSFDQAVGSIALRQADHVHFTRAAVQRFIDPTLVPVLLRLAQADRRVALGSGRR